MVGRNLHDNLDTIRHRSHHDSLGDPTMLETITTSQLRADHVVKGYDSGVLWTECERKSGRPHSVAVWATLPPEQHVEERHPRRRVALFDNSSQLIDESKAAEETQAIGTMPSA
ncbi:MAG: hypothetical protein LKF99_01900 [Bifidobacterium sp.]|nr:hypothetical protein [Bifidobacterium sp.]